MTNSNDGLDMTGGVDLGDTSNYDAAPGDRSVELDQMEEERTLVDRGLEDPLDEGYSPPEKWSPAEKFGNTAEEMHDGESLDQRLAQEVPDVGEPVDHVRAALDEPEPASHEEQIVGDDPATDDFEDLDSSIDDSQLGQDSSDGEVGDRRAGRLVDPNEGFGEDVDKDLVGSEVGIDGAGASAEEAAVHVVPDDLDDSVL